MNTKGRLAPSPTGAQHLGNARTYLLAYWSARKSGAKLALRIEDIDSPRVKPWAAQQAIDDLRWLGIDWEEGPDIGGENGPYVQTQRVDLYDAALQKLINANRVFPCICTRKDIVAAASAPHESEIGFAHEGPIYPGTCAGWRAGESIPEAGTFCWRFRPSDDVIKFDDLVLGKQSCRPAEQLGAFPITQKNGNTSYQLAVVVDDAQMGITEVVRGDDLVPSTFRQIDLFAALGYEVPTFAHVPLVVGTDGRRLAKRHGDTRLSQYREQGIDADQIVGWAAHSAGLFDERQPVSAQSIVASFDWQKLSRGKCIVENDPF
ncbi:tRNA glutamyl-Q(34) synthetase GluQRS [Planctomycetes bacterium K23_9]|uniref:Glutamate--tRNA ligase 2 n=1 Tax=Stieleria marina TaxID=1930275 RepID=A0A517NZ74_9BACT|nr:Glutamate--tRNA ligase 2 [Planctomycetes bacterium K23_9]